MVKQQLIVFLLRWLASTLGMWLCIDLFGEVNRETNLLFYIIAGLIFSLVNSIVKPLAKTFALPLIILTSGVAMILVNIAMVALTIWLLPGVEMDFWQAAFSSLILSLINWLVNFLVPSYNEE